MKIKITEEITKVRIDSSDLFNLDYTLALIILPALKRFKQDNQGSPNTELVDGDNIENIHDRWDCILDKMIWSFENILDDKETDYITSAGYDKVGLHKYNQKIQEGLKLFGKYYRNLWS